MAPIKKNTNDLVNNLDNSYSPTTFLLLRELQLSLEFSNSKVDK
ncbi:MAG TPA: hypothetical protein VFR61_06655 [Nitrososphaeraceae archaeon]|nr:hypothetical protein [Nitrososphaeraceae archaeon]